MHVFIPGGRAAIRPAFRFHAARRQLGILAFAMALAVGAFCQGALAHGFKAGDLEIGHPWSRVVPQGAKVAAGYLKLTNNGAVPDRLVSATAEIAGKAEIHEMSVDASGVMSMRGLPDGVEIPAGATVEFKPGSYHIMFMGLDRWAKEGETFKGTLTFEKAGTVDVEFKVQPMGSGEDKNSGDHGSHAG